MPRKIRDLKSDLRNAGFAYRRGKGSHTVWKHPLLAEEVVLSGNDGDDAKPYQEGDVRRALRSLRDVQRRQQ